MLRDASGYETGTGADVTTRFRFTLIESGRPLSKVFYRREDGVVDKIASAQLAEGYAREFTVGSLEELNELLDRLTGKQAAIWGVTGRPGKVKVVAEKYRGDGEITRTLKYFAWPTGPGFLMIDLDRPENPEPGFYYPEREAAVAAIRSLHSVFAEVPILWRPSASSGVEGEGIKGQRLYVPVRDASLISEAGAVLADLQWIKGWGRIELAKDGSPLTRGLIDTAPWQPNWLDFVGPPVLRDGIRREPPPAFIAPGLLDSADLAPLLRLDTKALRREADALRDRAKRARAREACAVRAEYKQRTGRDYLPDDPLNAVQTLGPDHVLEDRHGDPITVGELLADPERWHGVQLRDPIEPDYRGGSLVAKAFLVNCQPVIVSYAHGKKRYRLHDPERDFAGLEMVEEEDGREEAGREEDGQQEIGDALLRPEPTWRDLELARKRQAIQNLYDSPLRQGEHFTSIKTALADPSVLALLAGMAAGKTKEVQETVIEYLDRDDPEEMLVVATPSFALMSEITREVLARLGDDCLKDGRLKVVASHEPLIAFVNPKTDARPYRVIVCSHAALLPRGHDIASVGRVLRKLQTAVDNISRHGGRPLRVWAMIDEVDAYLHRLVVTLMLGLMEEDTTDPIEGTERKRPVLHCPATCPTCFPVLDYATHSRGSRAGKIPVFKIAPSWPELPGATPVNVAWLKDALLPPSHYNGVAVSHIDPSLLPSETEKPLFDTVPNKHGTGLKLIPLAEGIVRELAAQPGATVRRGRPRDLETGEYLDPRKIPEGREVRHPFNSCAPRLVSFNPRPLAELRAVTDRLTLMTATLSRTGEAMISTALGPSKTAIVVTPPERKLKRLLVIGVTRWTMDRALHADLVAIKPTILFHAQKNDAEEHADTIASWRDGNLLPATWGRRGAEADVRGRVNLMSAYTRAAIGLGYNLPFYRITVIWSNCYVGTQSIFALGYDDLFSAIEGERQNIVLQNGGRTLRWDTEDPLDNGYRVIVVVIAADAKTGLPAESLDWAVNGWKGNAEHIELLMLNAFPRRTVQAARDWLTTGETAVNDLPAGPVSGMSGRQRLLTTGARQAASAAKKEARREEKRRQARAMVESGSAWREVRNTLNLTYDFSREECERLKNELFGG
jgi:hypothetical protein